MIDVMPELRSIGEMGVKGEYHAALARLNRLWEAIPEPKTAAPNVYLVVEYAVELLIRAGDINGAWHWAQLAPQYNKRRQDLGEAEFLLGRVAFERGDFDTAAENFVVANKKSNGRIFRGEDPKYKAIIKGR